MPRELTQNRIQKLWIPSKDDKPAVPSRGKFFFPPKRFGFIRIHHFCKIVVLLDAIFWLCVLDYRHTMIKCIQNSATSRDFGAWKLRWWVKLWGIHCLIRISVVFHCSLIWLLPSFGMPRKRDPQWQLLLNEKRLGQPLHCSPAAHGFKCRFL